MNVKFYDIEKFLIPYHVIGYSMVRDYDGTPSLVAVCRSREEPESKDSPYLFCPMTGEYFGRFNWDTDRLVDQDGISDLILDFLTS